MHVLTRPLFCSLNLLISDFPVAIAIITEESLCLAKGHLCGWFINSQFPVVF